MTIDPNIENFRSQLRNQLEKNPQDIDTLIQLGALEFECFHNDELALSLLQKAVELDSVNISAKFWIAMCLHYDCLEYDRARKILNDALKIEPTCPECLSLMASIIRESNGPLYAAIEYVNKAITYAPDWPMLRCKLARYYFLSGKLEAAEQEVQNALALFSSHQPKQPANEVERYYDSVVTGKGWTNLKEEFDGILKDIQKAKSSTQKSS